MSKKLKKSKKWNRWGCRERELYQTEKNEGITLIALIVTIIVLLILAGISISMLTGQNGILPRASEAKEKTEKANLRDLVQIALIGSYNEIGEIDWDRLNGNLEEIEGLTNGLPISTLPATLETDEYNIIIRKDGTVVVSEWKQTGYEITNGKITVKVGDYVLNYDELSEEIQNVSVSTSESGHTDIQTLNTENLGWRILGVGENGSLELISDK